MEMKSTNAVLRLTPWSDSVGAKAHLQKAWVRIRNIPSEKRCEEHVAYAGSLVGVTLEIDQSTLYRPEYVRALIGCRDVEKIPDKAEGCLGENFYDFYYEIDKVVVGGPPKSHVLVPAGQGSSAPSPKRARTENYSQESSEGQTTGGNHTSENTGYGKSYAPGLTTVSEHESEEESEGDQGLLIDQLRREQGCDVDSAGEKGDDDINSPVSHEMVNAVDNLTHTPVVEQCDSVCEAVSDDIAASHSVVGVGSVDDGSSMSIPNQLTSTENSLILLPSVGTNLLL
jgi:hypothetical protein